MPETVTFRPELLDSHCIIDVRTPLEFAEDHLPGAVNVPILTNEERVEVGIIHKQIGSRQARMRGLELTCGRFAAMVREVEQHAGSRPVLVYCWRGGLRSRSMAVLLESAGVEDVLHLRGGYKAFRGLVNAFFEQFAPPQPLVVIHGMTGVGKTGFIRGLDPRKWTTIDLEELACHRGSAFGLVGQKQELSQKKFDTQLWQAFRMAPADRPIVLEGESRRIGGIFLPGRLYDVMSASCRVWCVASLETRVRRLTEEYAREEYRAEMAIALQRIGKKLGSARYAELSGLLERWEVAALARGLVEQYYDKMYYRNRTWQADHQLELEDFAAAERQLDTFWRRRHAS